VTFVFWHHGQIFLLTYIQCGSSSVYDHTSTSQRAVMPCGWGVKADMVRVWVAGKTVWSPCYKRVISERFRDKELIIKCYINSPSLLLLFLHENLCNDSEKTAVIQDVPRVSAWVLSMWEWRWPVGRWASGQSGIPTWCLSTGTQERPCEVSQGDSCRPFCNTSSLPLSLSLPSSSHKFAMALFSVVLQ